MAHQGGKNQIKAPRYRGEEENMKTMEKTVVKRFLFISDTHDCPEGDFGEIAEIARIKDCNVIIHMGDFSDEHILSKIVQEALKDFQVYFYYVPKFNKKRPSQYGLPENWHLLKGGESVLHFNYIGHDDGLKEYCVYVSHNLGFNFFDFRYLKAKIKELLKEEESTFFHKVSRSFSFVFNHFKERFRWLKKKRNGQLYELADLIFERFKKEHLWVNVAGCGHTHRGFLLCAKGDKIINPGAWYKKNCFAILKPGPLDVHYYSLTEDEVRVVRDLRTLKD